MAVTKTDGAREATLTSDSYAFGADADAQIVDVSKARGSLCIHVGSVLSEHDGSAFNKLLLVRNGTGIEAYVSLIPTSSTTKGDAEWYFLKDSDDANPFASAGTTARISFSTT